MTNIIVFDNFKIIKKYQLQCIGSYSNYIIRCHYGIIIPDNCYVYVRDEDTNIEEKHYYKQFEWLIFDDSKFHYAENSSNKDRIVLILDIERPKNIKIGTSTVEDSSELVEIINQFKKIYK